MSNQTATNAYLNAPVIGSDGKPTQKAITDAAHVKSIGDSLRSKAIAGRIATAGRVLEVYNANPPFDPSEIKALNQSWRNNFSSQFLHSVIERTRPQFPDPLNSAETITYSALPSEYEGAAQKSKKFQTEITNLIRGWSGWDSFLSSLTLDIVLHGSSAAIHLDDDWRPSFFGYGDLYFPKGTKQHAKEVQYFVIYQPMLLHDFMASFANREAAELAHYNVDNCIKIANADSGVITDETAIEQADAVRENSSVDGSMHEQRVVELYHLVTQEHQGGIDLWTVSKKSGMEIRHVSNLHPEMEEGLTVFTIQAGNSKLYGSKGLARQLANIALSIERNRCIAADQIWLGGLPIVQGEDADLLTFRPTIHSPFVLVNSKFTIAKEGVKFNSEAFEMMDNKQVAIAESIAGSFIPPNLDNSGTSNTKIEAAQKAEREQAIEKGVLGRFVAQAGLMIGAMQRKICCPINLKEALRIHQSKQKAEGSGIRLVKRKAYKLLKDVLGDDPTIKPEPESKIGDPDAVVAIVNMLEGGLSIQDIALLAMTPAGNDEKMAGADKDINTASFVAENAQNPNLDQYEATKMAAEIRIGADRAARIMLKKSDPNVEAEATRMQLFESAMMMEGQDIPVVSTDRHDIHRGLIGQKLQEIIPQIEQAPTPELLNAATLFIKHGLTHLQMDINTPEEMKGQEEQAFAQIQKLVSSQIAFLQKQEATQQAAQAQGQGEQPSALDHQASAREDAKTMADMTMKAADQELKGRALDIKAKEVEHKMEVEKARLFNDEKTHVAQVALESEKLGLQEAALDKKKVLAGE